jgi:hypothetical protein
VDENSISIHSLFTVDERRYETVRGHTFPVIPFCGLAATHLDLGLNSICAADVIEPISIAAH